MKNQLEYLEKLAWDKIEVVRKERNTMELERVNRIIFRLDEMGNQLKSLEDEFKLLESELTSSKSLKEDLNLDFVPTQRILQSKDNNDLQKPILVVKIDWSLNGKPHGRDVLYHKTASAGMALIVKRLHEVLGDKVLQIGSGMDVSRGKLLSDNPSKDFLNIKNGTTYSHRPIGSTGYYVMTHSDTPQKVADLKHFFVKLGLTAGSYKVMVTSSSKDLN